MKQNPNYILRKIADVPYLLPFGQMVADQKRGLRINETGEYLWNLLAQEQGQEELLATAAAYYQILPRDRDTFDEDIIAFLQQLMDYGLLIDDSPWHQSQGPRHYMQIGGLSLCFHGNKEAFPEEFQPFCTSFREEIHQSIFLHPFPPRVRQNGTLLLRNRELAVIRQEDFYILLFPQFTRLHEIHISQDGSRVICYHIPDYCPDFRTDLFHALRFCYLYLALQKGRVALHSASLLYNKKLWLFTGSSGTGKSTHTNLWKELYDITLINGDLNLIDTSGPEILVPGIPWCGTSGICHTSCHPLGGIILLKQASADLIEELPTDRKELLVSQRFISPSWTNQQFDLHLIAAQKIAQQIPICMLHCTPRTSAVHCMKEWIDSL